MKNNAKLPKLAERRKKRKSLSYDASTTRSASEMLKFY